MGGKSRLLLPALLAVTLLLAGTAQSAAQVAGEVNIEFTPVESELTVGDPVSLGLRVTHPNGYQAIFPRLPETWGEFEVRSQSRVETTVHEDGTQTASQEIEVTLFAPGTYETPDLPITLRDATGQVFERFAPPISLAVLPTLGEDDAELHDIKSQASLRVPPVWPWIAGGMLMLSLIAVALYLFLKRRASPQLGLAPAVDTRSPYRVALDELARVEQLDLPGRGLFKEHYTLVADCVRRYLEAEFLVPALDRTTDEIHAGLGEASIPPDPSRDVVGLLLDCDLVKFAKLEPDAESARECTGRARDLVELIRPAPEPAPAETSPGMVEVEAS